MVTERIALESHPLGYSLSPFHQRRDVNHSPLWQSPGGLKSDVGILPEKLDSIPPMESVLGISIGNALQRF